MSTIAKKGMLASKAFDSRIKSANVQNSERWLGYFAGPGLVWVAYYVVAGTYLNVFYTDVLKIGGVAGGLFLMLLPILSKIFDAITNILMGQIIDRTKSRQGKARPWLLISAPLVGVTGVMLYVVPQASQTVQALWIAISYNLFFAFAFTVYNMSHQLMVPLCTRNVRQRDGLALFSNMGTNMLPGALIYMVFPLVALPWMGVVASRWSAVMSIFSILAIPAILIQYFFTKERITEESLHRDVEVRRIPFSDQLKAVLTNKYWIFFILMMVAYQMQQAYYNANVIYYANWVLGTYNDGKTLTLINAIGQAPLGLGVFLLWPVVKKLGKRKAMIAGMLLAAVSTIPMALMPTNLGAVLGTLFFKSFGMLPTYLFMAMMAEAMDHVEWKSGFRCDGLTSAVYSVIITVSAGFATGIFNIGLTSSGYVPPASDGTWITQNAGVQRFFIFGFAVVPIAAFILMAILAYFNRVEELMPVIQSDMTARHKAEAAARGEVYLSLEEKTVIEQRENDRIAEEKRIEEQKARCARKGLSFEEEEAKVQKKKRVTK